MCRFLASYADDIVCFDAGRMDHVVIRGADHGGIVTRPRVRGDRLMATLSTDATSGIGGVVHGRYDADRGQFRLDGVVPPTQFRSARMGHHEFSPDGSLICFALELPDRRFGLRIGRLVGNRIVVDHAIDDPHDTLIDPSWTGRGDLLYVRNEVGTAPPLARLLGGANTVWRHRLDDGADEQLHASDPQRGSYDPYESPDGSLIAYLQKHDLDLWPTRWSNNLIADGRTAVVTDLDDHVDWWVFRGVPVDVTVSVPQWVDDLSWLTHRYTWPLVEATNVVRVYLDGHYEVVARPPVPSRPMLQPTALQGAPDRAPERPQFGAGPSGDA